MTRPRRSAPPEKPATDAAPAPRAARRPLPPWLLPLGAAALHLALCLAALDPGPYDGGDNGVYVALAEGLLERGAYVDYWDPAMRPHTQYPPVFPLILAGGMAAGLSVWVGVKLLCIVLSAVAVALSALWLRRVLPPRAATAAALLTAAAAGPLMLAGHVLSDVPFWAWCMLALWAYARADEEPGSWRWEAAGAAGVALAYLTRTAALPLIVAVAGWLVLRRRWRALGILAAGVVPPALLWAVHTGGAGGYTGFLTLVDPYVPEKGTIGLGGMAARVGDNLILYGHLHFPSLFYARSGRDAPVLAAAAVAVMALAAAGWALRVRRPGPAELFAPLYVAILLVWPATWGGERFLLPLLPVVVAYVAVALAAAAGRLRVRALAPVAAAVLALGVIAGIVLLARLGSICRAEYRAGSAAPCRAPEWSELLAVGALVDGRLPPGSVVLHRKPSLFYAASGYRSRVYPVSRNPDQLLALARETGAGYVVIDQTSDLGPYLNQAVAARPHVFCIVRELSYPRAVLARIVPDAPPHPPGMREGLLRTCPVAGPPFPQVQQAAGGPQAPSPPQ